MFAYSMAVKRICFSQIFSISAEIQPIVSSKQPIVFTLSALVKFVFDSKCFNMFLCSNQVMFMENNVLITSLNTKYLCNNCSLWIRFLLILEIKTAFKGWSNQHVILCTLCYDWHKLLYGSNLILFSILKITQLMPTLTKGYGYICDAIKLLFSHRTICFSSFFSLLLVFYAVSLLFPDLSYGCKSSIC